ncbi:MAG: GldG family protein [Deltaproteobacteria bacterium]|nr:GldG family protein [Deltaproteobacteria bacterium]
MKRNYQYSGIAGLVLIAFGLICAGIISNESYTIALTHLGLGVIFILLFLLGGGTGSLRSSAVKRLASFSLTVFIYTLLFVGVLIVVNYMSQKHELFRFDSTEQKIYTLAPQTIDVLAKLSAPLEIRAFYLGGKVDDPKTEDLIKRLVRQSSLISFQVIDPEKQPSLVEKYGVSENRTLHLSYQVPDGEKKSKDTKLVRDFKEEDIVNAIIRLSRGKARPIYYISGHGEPSLDEKAASGYLFLKDAIAGENYEVKDLNIGNSANIPADAAAVILASPQKELLPTEFQAIESYLAAGGRMVFLHQPKSSDDIVRLVKPLGIEIGKDIIVEPIVQIFSGASLGVSPMITAFAAHDITKERPKDGAIFGLTSSVQKTGKVVAGGRVVDLALTGKNSWAETNLALLFSDNPQAQQDKEDIAGPVSVVSTFQRVFPQPEGTEQTTAKETRVVVFGNAEFVNNQTIRKLFNQDFFLNSLNWVVGDGDAVTIRAGSMRRSTKAISEAEFRALFLFGGIYVPELLLLVGLAIWWLRKSKD